MRPRRSDLNRGRTPCAPTWATRALLLVIGCGAPAQAPEPAADVTPVGVGRSPPLAAPTETTPIPTPDTSAPPTATPDPATPTIAPASVPAASPTPASNRVRVIGTEGQGANLRQEPNPAARVLRGLREGAALTLIGPDREVDGRTWRNVRDDDGTGGWVTAEVLQIALPTPTPTAADLAAPCRVGQLKGDATTAIYYPPDHSQYRALKERVRCFDSESQARAAGFRAP